MEYPTDEELEKIENWKIESEKSIRDLISYIVSLWKYADSGFTQITGNENRDYYLSTGGWSGNEDLIRAMEKNWMFWALTWFYSIRGGHYLFKIPLIKESKNENSDSL